MAFASSLGDFDVDVDRCLGGCFDFRFLVALAYTKSCVRYIHGMSVRNTGRSWFSKEMGHQLTRNALAQIAMRDESNRVLDVALEMTRSALGLADDFANGIIARQIVELARAGERNPDLLCEGALKKLRGALFGD